MTIEKAKEISSLDNTLRSLRDLLERYKRSTSWWPLSLDVENRRYYPDKELSCKIISAVESRVEEIESQLTSLTEN
nr:MAG TPA: hypothetical protein [Caudoviricetes sp.]